MKRRWVTWAALLLVSIASASVSSAASPGSAAATVSQADLARMEAAQAARSSTFGGGFVPAGPRTVTIDGKILDVVDSATVSVQSKAVQKSDAGATDIGASGCTVSSSLVLGLGLAGVKVNKPTCSGLRVNKIEVQWYKQSVSSRTATATKTRTGGDSCWWHCSGEYTVNSHDITLTQRVWPTVTWTFSDGQQAAVTHIKWAYNDLKVPYPQVQDTRSLGFESWVPFRIPTISWTQCEDDPTKTPTCARSSSYASSTVRWYLNNQIPLPNCSQDPKGTTAAAHHITPLSKAGGNEAFLNDGQGVLLCPTQHDKFHTDTGNGVWWNHMVPHTNV